LDPQAGRHYDEDDFQQGGESDRRSDEGESGEEELSEEEPYPVLQDAGCHVSGLLLTPLPSSKGIYKRIGTFEMAREHFDMALEQESDLDETEYKRCKGRNKFICGII
jgi:hypothetical protein